MQKEYGGKVSRRKAKIGVFDFNYRDFFALSPIS